MNVQRFLLATERKDNDVIIGYDGCHAIDGSRVIIWFGRPLQYPPVNPLLNRWSHIALLDGQPCWVEKVGHAVPLTLLLPLSRSEAKYIFFQLHTALNTLHQANCHHGSLSVECIWIQSNGLPLITGIGRVHSSPEQDLQQLHLLALQTSAINGNQPLSQLHELPIPATLLQQISSIILPIAEREIILEMLAYPSGPELDLFEEDEHTQSQGLMDITHSEEPDMTGALYLQSELGHHAQIYASLESWLSDIKPLLHSTEPYSAGQIQQLLNSIDPLTTPLTLSSIEFTEPKWEHTEHKPTQEFSVSDTHSKTIYKKKLKRPNRLLFLFILFALLLGFILGRL